MDWHGFLIDSASSNPVWKDPGLIKFYKELVKRYFKILMEAPGHYSLGFHELNYFLLGSLEVLGILGQEIVNNS